MIPDWGGAVQALTGTDKALQDVLQSLARKAGDDMAQFRREIEQWFDDMMERASGWYKRKTQAVQFFAALALALWLDIDAIRLLRVLWVDAALRASIVAEAEAFARNPPPELLPPAVVTAPSDELQLWFPTNIEGGTTLHVRVEAPVSATTRRVTASESAEKLETGATSTCDIPPNQTACEPHA